MIIVRYVLDHLSTVDERHAVDAVRTFPDFVGSFVPDVEFDLAPLDHELARSVLDPVGRVDSFADWVALGSDRLIDVLGLLPLVVVLCRPDSTYAQLGRAEVPHALWGLACGQVSVIYHHDRPLIWHEMLHLLAARDCYDLDPSGRFHDRTCGLDHCLMQYAPSAETVGDAPALCEPNVRRVRKRCQKWRRSG